ncbi:MAG: sigma-70 family RNA polymerase sigma factor [Oscillospiraceae bacterium]
MNHPQEHNEKDELRARFTGWLEVLISRARINYLKKLGRQVKTVSLDEIPETVLSVESEVFFKTYSSAKNQNMFDFEEEHLAKAFSGLPLMRQRILIMLFVEEKKPEEIAGKLHCTVQNVYNQRSLALKKLRQMLTEGGEDS